MAGRGLLEDKEGEPAQNLNLRPALPNQRP